MDLEFPLNDGAAGLVFRRWLEQDRRAAQLSATYRYYYRVRSLIPIVVRQWLQRNRRAVNVGPDWYLPDAFYDELVRAVASDAPEKPVIHPWPSGARSALVLTHDVETKAGIANIEKIADMEQELGFRSSWYFVAKKYPLDRGLMRELQSRGFEIGVHGYNHDGRLYETSRVFTKRARFINESIRDFQADGFRSPMVHRNLDWLQQLDVRYDTSCFDIDPFQAMPGGLGSIWPFRAGKFVELPYTLPQDHTLFVALGEKDGQTWDRKARWLARRGGMLLMLTHPDYLDTPWKLEIYRDFLTRLRDEPRQWNALPRDVAIWWRSREQSTVAKGADGIWEIQGDAAQDGTLAWLLIDDNVLEFAARDQAGELA